MATVSFNYRGKKRELEVPQSFFNLPPEQQKATISSMMGGQKEEEGGLWDATKDVAKGVGGGMATVLRGLGKPQGAVAGGLFDIQKQRMRKEPTGSGM